MSLTLTLPSRPRSARPSSRRMYESAARVAMASLETASPSTSAVVWKPASRSLARASRPASWVSPATKRQTIPRVRGVAVATRASERRPEAHRRLARKARPGSSRATEAAAAIGRIVRRSGRPAASPTRCSGGASMSATPAAAAPQARGTLGEFTPDPHQRVNAYKKVQGSLGATGPHRARHHRGDRHDVRGLRLRALPRRLDALADAGRQGAPSTRSRSPSCSSWATSSSCC